MYEHGEYFLTLEAANQRCAMVDIPTTIETIPLNDAYGRILATDLVSNVDDPPFDNSSMDGFAVRYQDTINASFQNPINLKIIGTVNTGKPSSQKVGIGEATSIMTGAPMPNGADAIVIIENTKKRESVVEIYEEGRPQYVRKRGENFSKGTTLLQRGTHLTPREVGLAAAMGFPTIPVVCKLTASIISTGDEIVQPGEKLAQGQIYESNSYGLAGLIEELGHNANIKRSVSDNINSLRKSLNKAAATSDFIITSGGVSMGDKDIVRKLMGEEGEILFWRVKLRPGSPPLFGFWNGTPLFGLPGNPVSSHVVFRMIVKPWLMHVTGATGPVDRRVKVELIEDVKGAKNCLTLRRISIKNSTEGLVATLPTHQGSGNIHSLVAANGLTLLPPNKDGKKGEVITAILF